jgi:hypothetical protein
MRFSKQSKRNTMIPDLQEDFKSVKKTWTNVSVVVGSTHTYQHLFEDGCQSMRGYTGFRYPGGPSTSEFGFEGSRTSTKAFRHSCYPDSDTESTNLEETQRRNRMYAENVCRRYCFGKKNVMFDRRYVVRMGIIFVTQINEKNMVTWSKCSSCPSNTGLHYDVPVCGTPRECCVRIDMVEFI